MKSSYRELKEQAWQANMEIPRRGLAIYTFGNVSAFDAERGVFAIKPSGVAYESLTAVDMVVVDLDARVVEGTLRPSSDTKTHAALYRAFRGVGGIVHTHSTYATAWAQACMPIPIYGTTHADHLAEDVPCTALMTADAVRGDYEAETGTQIVDCFRTRDPAKPNGARGGPCPVRLGQDRGQGGLPRRRPRRACQDGGHHARSRPPGEPFAGLPRAQALRAQAREGRLLWTIVPRCDGTAAVGAVGIVRDRLRVTSAFAQKPKDADAQHNTGRAKSS